MPFSARLERGKHSVELVVNFKTLNISNNCLDETQAERLAKKITTQHMQGGWKLVILNGKKVKQGKLLIPDASTISKFEKVPSYIKPRIINDGTVGREE